MVIIRFLLMLGTGGVSSWYSPPLSIRSCYHSAGQGCPFFLPCVTRCQTQVLCWSRHYHHICNLLNCLHTCTSNGAAHCCLWVRGKYFPSPLPPPPLTTVPRPAASSHAVKHMWLWTSKNGRKNGWREICMMFVPLFQRIRAPPRVTYVGDV